MSNYYREAKLSDISKSANLAHELFRYFLINYHSLIKHMIMHCNLERQAELFASSIHYDFCEAYIYLLESIRNEDEYLYKKYPGYISSTGEPYQLSCSERIEGLRLILSASYLVDFSEGITSK